MALQIGIGNFNGAIAANIYLSKDSPRYVLGCKTSFFSAPSWSLMLSRCRVDGLELMFVSIGLIVVPILVFLYSRINNARDEALRQRIERGGKLNLTIRELRDLGDRAPDFRYTL